MLDISKINIEIITKQNIPININNPVLNYIQDKTRQEDGLFAKVYYDGIEIGKGIILDFYKKFEIIEDFGEPYTKIISFEHKGDTKYENTYFGNMIYKIKNFKNPQIDIDEREKYIQKITAIFKIYLSSLEDKVDDLKLTYIPSSAKISDDVAKKLSILTNKEVVKIVDKNPNDKVDSKSLTTIKESLEHAKTKYIFNDEAIRYNQKSQFVIIDDVLGNGSTIFTILKKLYDTTHMLNYFLVVVKDVKR